MDLFRGLLFSAPLWPARPWPAARQLASDSIVTVSSVRVSASPRPPPSSAPLGLSDVVSLSHSPLAPPCQISIVDTGLAELRPPDPPCQVARPQIPDIQYQIMIFNNVLQYSIIQHYSGSKTSAEFLPIPNTGFTYSIHEG